MANQNRKYRSLLNWLYVFALLFIIGLSMVAILSLIHQTGDAIDEELYFPEDKDNPDQLEYADYVASASKEFGVDEAIIYAIIYCESKFDPEVVSSVGARGLMQIMPATFEEIQEELGEKYDVDALFEPQINIRYGTYYLSKMYERFGDWEIAFAAYNAGPTTVSKWLKNEAYCQDGKLIHIPYAETDKYVTKVTGMVEKYKDMYENETEKS